MNDIRICLTKKHTNHMELNSSRLLEEDNEEKEEQKKSRYGAHPDASKHKMLAIKQVCNYVFNTAVKSFLLHFVEAC